MEEIDSTQVLDLGYEDVEESIEKKEIGKLKTLKHKVLHETEFPIFEGANVIGRDDRSDVKIKLHSLSKKHICIEACAGNYLVYDLDSRNKSRKGNMVLKPYVRYNLNDGDKLTFGDLDCQFIISCSEDLDETVSLSGSETGSESLIPEEEEDILQLSDELSSHENRNCFNRKENEGLICNVKEREDNISSFTEYVMPLHECHQKELNVSNSSNSSVIMPTQDCMFDNGKKGISQLFQRSNRDTFAVETDSESDEVEERVDTPSELIIEQTPGVRLGSKTNSCISESPLVEHDTLNETDSSKKSKKRIDSHKCNNNGNNFIANAVFHTPPHFLGSREDMASMNEDSSTTPLNCSGENNKELCDNRLECINMRETCTIECAVNGMVGNISVKTANDNHSTKIDENVGSDDEDITGTYVFDLGEFEDESETDEGEVEVKEVIGSNYIPSDDNIDPMQDVDAISKEEPSQVIGRQDLPSVTSTQKFENIQSFGGSSDIYIDAANVDPVQDVDVISKEEPSQVIGRQDLTTVTSIQKIKNIQSFLTKPQSSIENLDLETFVDDSEEVMATQPYQLHSPSPSPKKIFHTKDHLSTDTQLKQTTLPGGSFSFSKLYNIDDIETNSNIAKTPDEMGEITQDYDEIRTQMYEVHKSAMPLVEKAGILDNKIEPFIEEIEQNCYTNDKQIPYGKCSKKSYHNDVEIRESDKEIQQLAEGDKKNMLQTGIGETNNNSDDDNLYDNMATQLYYTETVTNLDDVSTQLYIPVNDETRDDGVNLEIETVSINSTKNEVIDSMEISSTESTNVDVDRDFTIVGCSCDTVDNEIIGKKKRLRDENIEIAEKGDFEEENDKSKKKKKSVRFSIDGKNIFIHSNEPEIQNDSKSKNKGKSELSAPDEVKNVLKIKQTKPSKSLRRTSPSIVDLLSNENEQGINDENGKDVFCESGVINDQVEEKLYVETKINQKQIARKRSRRQIKGNVEKKSASSLESIPQFAKNSKASRRNKNADKVSTEEKLKCDDMKLKQSKEVSEKNMISSETDVVVTVSDELKMNENQVKNASPLYNEKVTLPSRSSKRTVTKYINTTMKGVLENSIPGKSKLAEEVNKELTRPVESKQNIKSSDVESVEENKDPDNSKITDKFSKSITTFFGSEQHVKQSKIASVEDNIPTSLMTNQKVTKKGTRLARSKQTIKPSEIESLENNVPPNSNNSEVNNELTIPRSKGNIKAIENESVEENNVPVNLKISGEVGKELATHPRSKRNTKPSEIGPMEINDIQINSTTDVITKKNTRSARSKQSIKPNKIKSSEHRIPATSNIADEVDLLAESNQNIEPSGIESIEENNISTNSKMSGEVDKELTMLAISKPNIEPSEIGAMEINNVPNNSATDAFSKKITRPTRSKRNIKPSELRAAKKDDVLANSKKICDEVSKQITTHTRSKRYIKQSEIEAVEENNVTVNSKTTDVCSKQIPASARSKRNIKQSESLEEGNVPPNSIMNEKVTEQLVRPRLNQNIESNKSEYVEEGNDHDNSKVTDECSKTHRPTRSKRNIKQTEVVSVEKGNAPNNSKITSKLPKLDRSKRSIKPSLEENVVFTNSIATKEVKECTRPAKPKRNIKPNEIVLVEGNNVPVKLEISEVTTKITRHAKSKRNIKKPSEVKCIGENSISANSNITKINIDKTKNQDISSLGSTLKNTERENKTESESKEVTFVKKYQFSVNNQNINNIVNVNKNGDERTVDKLDTNENVIKMEIPEGTRRNSNTEKPKVIFTGINDKIFEKIVIDLGGEVVESILNATHLVTDKVRRTVKFLCAVAKGIVIVHPEWLISAKSSKVFTATYRHILVDDVAERRYKFQLHRSLEKALKTPLFKNYKVYITKNVKPELKYMKEMIESAGGMFLLRVPKTSSDNIIVVSCAEDEKEYEKLLHKGFTVCSKEVILTGILRQHLDFNEFSIANINDLDISQFSDANLSVSGSKRKASTISSPNVKRKR